METNNIKLDSHGGLDKLKCRIFVRGDMQKKHALRIEDTYSPPAPFRVLKHFLAYAARHKCRTYQFYVVGAFLQAKMRSRVPSIYIRRDFPRVCCILWKTYHAFKSNIWYDTLWKTMV
jgi:hypothetical protein